MSWLCIGSSLYGAAKVASVLSSVVCLFIPLYVASNQVWYEGARVLHHGEEHAKSFKSLSER